MDAAHRMAITVCGDGGCGKSSITLRLVRSQWMHEYDPTIEDSYSVTRTIDGSTYSLSLTDTAGQEEYRGLWSAMTMTADAFLLVYDITSAASLRQLEYFDSLIAMERDARDERRAIPPVCIVAGNKCDLQSLREVEAREGLDWARRRGYGFMETSAREMVNVEETFQLLVRRVVEARRSAGIPIGGGDGGGGGGGGTSYSHDRGKSTSRHFLPASMSRTLPLGPMDEKLAGAPASPRSDSNYSSDRRQRRRWERQRWWKSILCM